VAGAGIDGPPPQRQTVDQARGSSADLQGDDLRACKLEPIMEVDGIAGEIAGWMRGDDGSIRRLFDRHDLGIEAVLAPRLLCPGADGASSLDVASFIAHDGVLSSSSLTDGAFRLCNDVPIIRSYWLGKLAELEGKAITSEPLSKSTGEYENPVLWPLTDT
jgi:hypothetical protein